MTAEAPPVELEPSQVPGYQPIPDGCPDWKVAMLERRNARAVQEQREREGAARAEQAKVRAGL